MDAKEKECFLSFDEMTVKKWLTYNSRLDKIEGYADMGNNKRLPAFASHAMVFMLRGIKYDWKQPLCYVLSAGPMRAKNLKRMVLKVLREIITVGLDVKVKNNLKLLPNVTERHFCITSFSKMKVRLAVQILSKSINDIFDCLNSRTLFDPNPLRRALSELNPKVEQKLRESIPWLSSLSTVNQKKTPPCISGLMLTIRSVLCLWREMKSIDCKSFLLTNRLNQDALENLFSILRQRSGSNNNPTCAQFRQNMQSVCNMSLMKPPRTSNCEADGDSSLLSPAEIYKICDVES
ncbi:hypothetical protein B566_EDAN005468, partial [Ephemera danica]